MTMYVHTEDGKKGFCQGTDTQMFRERDTHKKRTAFVKKKVAEMPLCFRQGLWARSCVAAKKVVPVLTEVLRSGYYPDDSNRRIINEEYHQYIFIQEDRFKLLSGVARMNKGKSHFNGDNFLISRLECGKAMRRLQTAWAAENALTLKAVWSLN